MMSGRAKNVNKQTPDRGTDMLSAAVHGLILNSITMATAEASQVQCTFVSLKMYDKEVRR